jgi:hypothetical protein
MSATVCAACGQELLPVLEMCFDCELGSPSPPPAHRATRRYRFDRLAGDQARLAVVLRTLCPSAPEEDVEWLAREGDFDVVAEVTSAEEQRLTAALEACGPRVAPSADVPPSSTVLRFSIQGRVPAKLAASAVIGGVTGALGMPIVPAAAVVMGCVLLARMPHVVERRLTVERAQVGKYVGVIDEAVVAEARAVRAAVLSPELRNLLRACLAHAAEISGAVRDGGAHVAVEGVRRADAAVAQLTRTMLRLVARAQRIAPPAGAAQSAQPYRGDARPHRGTLEQLHAFAADFGALRASAAQLRAKDTSGAAAAALLAGTTRLTNACASALEAIG